MRSPSAGKRRPDDVLRDDPGTGGAGELVTVLYQQHATDLIRCAVVILGDRAAAEDVVQEAFCGLLRRWSTLSDPAKSLPYVRSAVLNRCRTVLRGRARRSRIGFHATAPLGPSAEDEALIGEEHRAVLAGLWLLPPRQREALALRFLADLDELVAVVAASLVITRHAAGRTPGTAAVPSLGVPPYYVAAWASEPNLAGHVEVRATSTGAVEATIAMPAPYNYNPGVLAAAAGDRVFILDGRDRTGRQRAFVLRLTPDGQGHVTTRLTPLSIPVSPTTSIPFALSPDGTRLAAVTYAAHGNFLTIYNLATGASRTWTGWARSLGSSFGSLAWSAGGRWLQYAWWQPATAKRAYFGRLDPSAPGTAVPAPTSSAALPFGIQMALLADGHLAVQAYRENKQSVDIVSPQGGAPVVIPIWGRGGPPVKRLQDPVWYGDTGETMILATPIPPLQGGVWRAGHYHPLRLPRISGPNGASLAW